MHIERKVLAMAVAVTSALAASSAVNADSKNVEIYGRLNVAFEDAKASDSTAGAATPSRNRVSGSTTDNIGFKGTQDLGDGLKAIWQVESSLKVDEGSGGLGARNSAAGLSGGWGTVFYGVWDTPFKVAVLGKLDPFGFGGVSAAGLSSIITNGAATAGNSPSAAQRAGFYRRQQNVVQYWTPNLAGFSGRVSYGANEEKALTRNPNSVSLLIRYISGPLYVAAAHERRKEPVIAGTTDTGDLLGAAYTFGNTTLTFVFTRLEYETAVGASTKRDAWHTSVKHQMGNHVVRAAYTNADDSTGNGAAVGGIGAPSAANDTGAKQVSLGYGYLMSTRTELYAQGTKITNEAAAKYDFPGNPLGIGAGADPQVFSLGIVHRF